MLLSTVATVAQYVRQTVNTHV